MYDVFVAQHLITSSYFSTLEFWVFSRGHGFNLALVWIGFGCLEFMIAISERASEA